MTAKVILWWDRLCSIVGFDGFKILVEWQNGFLNHIYLFPYSCSFYNYKFVFFMIQFICKGLLKQPKTIIKKIIRQQTPMRGMGVFTMYNVYNVAHYDFPLNYHINLSCCLEEILCPRFYPSSKLSINISNTICGTGRFV